MLENDFSCLILTSDSIYILIQDKLYFFALSNVNQKTRLSRLVVKLSFEIGFGPLAKKQNDIN